MRRTDLPGGGEVSATATANAGVKMMAGADGKGIRAKVIAERFTAALSTTTAGTSPRTMQQFAFTLADGTEGWPQHS